MNNNHFSTLGFGKNEQKVYLGLFDSGKTTASELISATGLHRNLVYTSLESLVSRGLVTKTKHKGAAMYTANDPAKLVEEVDSRRQIAEELAESLRERHDEVSREVAVLEGLDGIKRIQNEALHAPSGETLYILGASTNMDSERAAQEQRFHTRREKKGLSAKMLYTRDSHSSVVHSNDASQRTSARYLPFGIEAPLQIQFIGDRLALSIPGADPLTFSIRSREAVEGFKSYFSFLWNQKIQTFEGALSYEDAFADILKSVSAGQEIQVLGMHAFDQEFAEFVEAFHHKRATLGVSSRILLNVGANDMHARMNNVEDTMVRTMSKGVITPTVFLLYGSKTLMSIPNERIYVQINSPSATTAFRAHFEHLWRESDSDQ